MRSGDQVKFTTQAAKEASAGKSKGYRRATEAETLDWYRSEAARGLDDAGESKLPPRSVYIKFDASTTFTVRRGRARYSIGYENPRSGFTLVCCNSTGTEAYVKTRDLEYAD